ncbi:MAG: Endonuclease, Uma2 family (restriction endonuclease fold) [Candidatus Kentron sp. G]|nr:MAG: Endonuclease, Uma2 family (restriction endonuclease fold) [Candidatus Kentron sp. G]VFM97711.1 MAG: Endonuclease, Uma2 family (restriction endonuclease fold) [Candidatus Kentron sp. G]VFM98386.1 MAG: Endonuclease, Uma2 family (restriction endonuclease fold) [Candidatus Kentron sp. G]
MNLPAERLATYGDILRAPPECIAQLIHGQLYTLPRPALRHSLACSHLCTVLGQNRLGSGNGGDDEAGGWWILYEPEIHLGNHVLVPDLAGWRRRRMPEFPDEAYAEIAPDWVCEILSPSNARLDRVVKMPLYAQFEVAHLWLLDPKLRTLEVFALREGKWLLWETLGDNDKVSAPPFETVRFDLGVLWP